MILFPCFPETEPGRPKMQKQLPAGLWMCEGHKTDGEYGRNTQATQVFSLSLSFSFFPLCLWSQLQIRIFPRDNFHPSTPG